MFVLTHTTLTKSSCILSGNLGHIPSPSQRSGSTTGDIFVFGMGPEPVSFTLYTGSKIRQWQGRDYEWGNYLQAWVNISSLVVFTTIQMMRMGSIVTPYAQDEDPFLTCSHCLHCLHYNFWSLFIHHKLSINQTRNATSAKNVKLAGPFAVKLILMLRNQSCGIYAVTSS